MNQGETIMMTMWGSTCDVVRQYIWYIDLTARGVLPANPWLCLPTCCLPDIARHRLAGLSTAGGAGNADLLQHPVRSTYALLFQ